MKSLYLYCAQFFSGKSKFISATGGVLLAGSGHLHASLMLAEDGSSPAALQIVASPSLWDTLPSGLANIYWDADKDGIFGEAGIGENSGDLTALSINPITSGEIYHFAMDSFDFNHPNATANLNVTLSDLSVLSLSVVGGTTAAFNDSDGAPWEVAFIFNQFHYGNVVSNVSHTPGLGAQDHQGVLTFTSTAVPEASEALVVLLGMTGLLGVRRRTR